jgi:hypothetical protein
MGEEFVYSHSKMLYKNEKKEVIEQKWSGVNLGIRENQLVLPKHLKR